MNGNQKDLSGTPATATHSIGVKDLVEYLRHLEDLHNGAKMGSRKLGEGIGHLIEILRPHSDSRVQDLCITRDVSDVAGVDTKRSKRLTRKNRVSLPDNLQSISLDDARRILENESYSKIQLVELGSIRFGISRSHLKALRREGVVSTIEAALRNELSLNVISQEARRGGVARSS